MIFKKIDMAGFKSFADKTNIEFDGGITAVVGPNGCGKSNVADAVRWVLGEQSSKLLRGHKMEDVIFSGTEKRKSLSYAEVSLSFDNKDRVFNLDFNEVCLTRKLYRSGESEYLINKEPCRLKDITLLLHDVGIGKEGYSIIGQGRVEQIISAKPEDRRAIFEEAAGVAKHKQKKEESERRLARTRENLIRINDIVTEQERQLNPMEKQAEAAKVYLKLKEELKTNEINAYLFKSSAQNESKQKLNNIISELTCELADKNKEINSLNDEYSKTHGEINLLDDTIRELHNMVLDASLSLEQASSEDRVLKERIGFLITQQQKYLADKELLENRIKNNYSDKQIKESEKRQTEAELLNLNKKLNEMTKEYLEVVNTLADHEDEVDTSRRQMVENLTNLADIKASLTKAETEKNALLERNNILSENIKILSSKISDTRTRLKQAEIELDEIVKNEKELLKIRSDKLNELKILNTDIEFIDNNLTNLKTIESREAAKFNMMQTMLAENEGYAYAVRKILETGKTDPEVKSLYEGTVANLFKTGERFETAIEMALGSSIQNIITKDENNAKKLVELLKREKFGRATFLPMSGAKSRRIEPEFKQLVRTYGIDEAINLINFDRKYQTIFEGLLGSTVICETLEKAIYLAKSVNYAFKIVSLEGDVLNPAGSISGGSRKNEGASILSREREIEALKQKVIETQDKLALEFTKLNTKRLAKISLEKELEQLNELIKNLEVEETKKQDEYEILTERLNTFTLTNNDSENEINLNITKIENLTSLIVNIKERENEIKTGKTNADDVISKRQKQFEELRVRRDKYNEELTKIKIELTGKEGNSANLENEIIRLEKEISEDGRKLRITGEDILKTEKTIMAAGEAAGASKDKTKLAAKKKELEEARAKLDSVGEFKKAKNNKLAELENSRLLLNADIGRISEKKFNEELKLGKIDSELEVLEQRISEEYGLSRDTCLPYQIENFNLNLAEIEISRIKKEIGKLGNININAIDDIVELRARYNEYITQKQDLLLAEADIVKAIKELSNEMTDKFDDDFKTIQENFGKVFKELFGGGNANLVLVPSEDGDPLNAGIEIIAQPPGKKLQSITLLSGGEKALTAIAILFAILKLRPMPFCLLDEIEAALDEANVSRFANYLKRFSKDTQFIVITHRKPTMELADSLYGVTMEEKGVSKIVSVKLSDAERMSEKQK